MIDLSELTELHAWMRWNGVSHAKIGDLELTIDLAAQIPMVDGDEKPLDSAAVPSPVVEGYESDYDDPDLWGGKLPASISRLAQPLKAKSEDSEPAE